MKSNKERGRRESFNGALQTSANRGPNSRFDLEAIIKALISKSSQCSILKTHNRLHPIPNSQPDSSLPDYLIFHTCIHNYLTVLPPFWSNCKLIQANYELFSNNDIRSSYLPKFGALALGISEGRQP